MFMIRPDSRRVFCRSIKLGHVHREQNRISHYLAAFGRQERRTVVWLGSGAGELPELCKKELAPG